MTFEQYKGIYEKTGRLPNTLPRKNPYSEVELERKYEKYVDSQERSMSKPRKAPSQKVDSDWEETKNESRKIYGANCLLLSRISTDTYRDIEDRSGGLHRIVDPAHVFPKGAFPSLKYDPENVIPLNRYSHTMLDQHRHPVTGEYLSPEELEGWWVFLVGKSTYFRLKSRT